MCTTLLLRQLPSCGRLLLLAISCRCMGAYGLQSSLSWLIIVLVVKRGEISKLPLL
jgi:hypothetical protein